MTILLSFIFAAGTVAVVVCVFAWNDPGYATTDDWDFPGQATGYRLGAWAEEKRPPHLHSEPTLDSAANCLYCGSEAHSTFLHASR
jgi:hypothetical protein